MNMRMYQYRDVDVTLNDIHEMGYADLLNEICVRP